MEQAETECATTDHKPTNGFPAHISVPGDSVQDSRRVLERCTSLPNEINVPVKLRHTSSRSRKRAHDLRNSVATASSDYYNQRRPQMSQLAVVQRNHSMVQPSTSPLRPITEDDSDNQYTQEEKCSSLIIDLHDLNGLQMADSRLFRYGSTSSLGPTASGPSTSKVSNQQVRKLQHQSSFASLTSSINRLGSMSSLCDGACTPTPCGSPPLRRNPFSVLKMSSHGIPLSPSTENQFLPLYINSETQCVYIFENGYYIPLSPENCQSLQNTAKMSVTQPPIPDRRSGVSATSQPRLEQATKIIDPPTAYFRFVQVFIVLYAICLDLPILLLCGIPALLCSLQARKANMKGRFESAKRLSKFVMCCSVLGIVAHVIFILSVMTMFLLLHFLGGYFN